MLSTPDIECTVKALADEIVRRLGDEVDLVFEYGSRIKGTTHRFSDQDLSYVPAHEETWDCITVLVDGMLFDLYPMHWSKLEQMASYGNVSSSVLLANRLIYSRNDEVLDRFRALGARLRSLLSPEGRPDAIRKAQEIFQETGYPFLLLTEAAKAGHRIGAVQQAQAILSGLLHCLAVLNQSCIDTRKLDQARNLPLQPDRFEDSLKVITGSFDPETLRAGCERLLLTMRALLLAEQRNVLRKETTYPQECKAMYPEARADLDKMLTACERRDLSMLKTCVVSIYYELMIRIALVEDGTEFNEFNSLPDFENDLAARGFPPLLHALERCDFGEFKNLVTAFDRRLREFFIERGVGLNDYRDLEDLRRAMAAGEV